MKARRHVPASLRPLAAALAALALAAAGCGDTPATTPIDSGPLYSCLKEDRAVPYVANLTRTSETGTYKAVLVSADPAPPIKGNNTWTIEIRDANDMPVDGLTLAPLANMPDHNHPPAAKPVVTAEGNGRYTVTPLYLFMAGFWEVSLSWQPAGGPKETIVFPICIAG